MQLDTAFDLFILDCQIRRLKPRSINAYRKQLSYFLRFCRDNGIEEIEKISSPLIKKYTLTLESKSITYQRNLLATIALFLSYCVKDELLKTKPKITLPNKESKVKSAFTQEDIKLILSKCKKQRDYLICLYLLETGVRLYELITTDIEDINFTQGLVKVRFGKSGERYVVVGVKLRKQLFIYLNGRKNGPLFLSQYKKRLTISGITSLMDRLREKTGIPYLTCHAFRRTFATLSLRKGMDINILARLMGHVDLQMLKNHYLDLSQQDLVDSNQKFSIVDNL